MNKLIVVIAAMLLLSGCDDDRKIFRVLNRDVVIHFIDPQSAQYGDIVYREDKLFACVGINGKNRYGGYVGAKYYMLWNSPSRDEWEVVFTHTYDTLQDCRRGW